MTDPIKRLAELVSYEEKEFYGVNKYVISYKQPNSQDPSKVWKHQAIEADLTDAAIEILVGTSAGERFCVHQDKDEKGYPVISNISDAKDAPAKASGGDWKKKDSKDWKPKDESGVAVGAAVKDSIDVIRLAHELGITEDEVWAKVSARTDVILSDKLAKEDKLRASKAAKAATSEKAAEVEKPKSRAELAKEKKAAEAKTETKAEPVKAKAKKDVEPEDEMIEQDVDGQPDLEDDDLDKVNF
jgi:hypothetical protein